MGLAVEGLFLRGIFARGSLLADSSDADVELPSIRHQPEGLEQLLARTNFTKTELQSLYRGFKNVSLGIHCSDPQICGSPLPSGSPALLPFPGMSQRPRG